MTRVIIEDNYKEKRQKAKVIIYLTEDKKAFRTIQPGDEFAGDYNSLVQHVTGSDLAKEIKNYHSFETL